MSKEEYFDYIKETGTNQCTLKIDSETAKSVENLKLSNFLNDVIKNRKAQLEKSSKDVDLLFYTWFDDLSGYLHFVLINAKHQNLPFQSKAIFVGSINQIVEKFLDPEYLDYLSKASWETLENDQQNKEDIVYVYKKLVKKEDNKIQRKFP